MKTAREISLAVFYGDLSVNVTGHIREMSVEATSCRLRSNGCFPGAGARPMCRRTRHICLASLLGPPGVSPLPLCLLVIEWK